MQPYAPRRTAFGGVLRHGDWHVKQYGIIAPGVVRTAEARAVLFAPAIHGAFACLPAPACTASRPGVAFVIEHEGRGADYVVLCWWDRGNELPLRVFVNEGLGWRPNGPSESVCVWDLQIIAFERDAYVRTLLRGHTASAARADYLAMVFAPDGSGAGPDESPGA